MNHDAKNDPSLNHSGDFRLWGASGGQVEYVGQRLEVRDGQRVLVLLLTDHDHWLKRDRLEPFVTYRLELPLTDVLPKSPHESPPPNDSPARSDFVANATPNPTP